jgi:hypothetical protein
MCDKPSVSSESEWTTDGDRSEGSTAAKLDVARPKSPTDHDVKSSTQEYISSTCLCSPLSHLSEG